MSVSAQRKKFINYKIAEPGFANNVNSFIFDAANRLWCLTDDGLYRANTAEPTGELEFERLMPWPTPLSTTAFTDRRGRLWLGAGRALFQVVDSNIRKYGGVDAPGGLDITGLAEDSGGQVYVCNRRELFALGSSEPNGDWENLPISLVPGEEIRSMIPDAEAGLWLGTSRGLIRYRDGRQTVYAGAQGIAGDVGRALAQDREGNLWVGTRAGVYKLAGEMIVSYTEVEGLPDSNVTKVFEDREGRIYAITAGKGVVRIAGGRVVPVPGSQAPPFDTTRNILLDGRGDWWLKTDKHLFRFPGPGLELRIAKKPVEGFSRPSDALTNGLHEDNAGRVWMTGYSEEPKSIYRFDPRLKHPFIERIELESDQELTPLIDLQSDRSGGLWLATHAQLARMRDGKVTFMRATAGLPETLPRALFSDSRGWLWIGLRYGGVSVTETPEADQPTFINFNSREGLASDSVLSIAEDDAGRIYLGTGRGLDQLDPSTGRIRHFTAVEGLAGTWVNHILKDSRGSIWIATRTGLSRLNLRAERSVDYLPQAYVSRIQVAGEDVAVPETGALEVPELELAASRNNLLIEYVGLSFLAEGTLRYQYKLEGVDQDWSSLSQQRSVNFARLSPASYRFLVRAVNQAGETSEHPAVIKFRILPPVWQRWWFVAAVVILAALAAYRFYRYRVERLVELERMRTRIATDLHDDIGSNLSRIAILSEVAAQRVDGVKPQVTEPLSIIAATSRELVDSMSDIVWATNPAKDHVGDLAQRMRRFASDIFTARNITFHFRVPSGEAYRKVSADVRRQVFLIFKESVNNVVRHSGCAEAHIELRIEGGRLELTVRDDGKGFDMANHSEGSGLTSMASRAMSIGGALEVISSGGKGTTVTLNAPLVAAAKPQDTRLSRE